MKKADIGDLKTWYAISCPTAGLRFDNRTLELMDSNHDGHIRSDEVLAAVEYVKSMGVAYEDLFTEDESAAKELEAILAKQNDLENLEPSDLEKAAMSAWEDRGKSAEVLILGEGTAEAEKSLKAVEKIIDRFFTPPEDMPLVTESPDVELPLADHLNPVHLEQILDFAEKCAKPLLGEGKESLTRMEWKRVKAKFSAYREWLAAKPVMSADAKSELEERERFLRYRLNLGKFLRNYVTMDDLYEGRGMSIFQTGVLRIDGMEMSLCFHVESESAHSALVDKSQCCVIYLKLTQPSKGVERNMCAVVTAGAIGGLYVGRNGVFYDCDGCNWEAVITKVVEAQVSLVEAFWMPWKKLGDGIAAAVRKFLKERHENALTNVKGGVESTQAGGAAMASSVAALGIGIGMVGAAVASVMAAVSSMSAIQLVMSVVAIVLLVSFPSVIIAWFRLRKRDLGAILNASGWAVNREMRFSSALACSFTRCASGPTWKIQLLLVILAMASVCAFAGYEYAKKDRSNNDKTRQCQMQSCIQEVKQ